MPGPNFELVSELMPVNRRDFPLADPTLLKPLGSNPLVDGEWLAMDSAYALARGAVSTTPLVFPVHTERGRYDTQAIGKVSVLFFGMYEAETIVYDSTGLAFGDPLAVADVTFGGLTRRGLKKATSGQAVVGYVTRLMTGKIRFLHRGVTILA
jgi:hypothetical protein